MEDTTVRYAGVDRASVAHAVCVVDAAGRSIDRFTVTHRAGDLATMCRRLARAGVGRVAIERPDGPVVEALMGAGLEVVGFCRLIRRIWIGMGRGRMLGRRCWWRGLSLWG